jgi:ribA/ribD-fused uncharacterized protein
MQRDTLITQIQNGFSPKWLHFWGHTPSEDGGGGKTCFSQWWAGHPFDLDGISYATAEHFMMAEKARLFDDHETLAEILTAKSPAMAKKLGRKVANFNDAFWLDARWDIVVRGNMAKFSQHTELKAFLLLTADQVIVEASPFDKIWGIGMAANHADAGKPARWNGLNLLGFALMEVRERLRKEHLP